MHQVCIQALCLVDVAREGCPVLRTETEIMHTPMLPIDRDGNCDGATRCVCFDGFPLR